MNWISVEKGLPEYSVPVLVAVIAQYETGAVKVSIRLTTRTHTDKDGEHWEASASCDTKFWMPLPEPPEL